MEPKTPAAVLLIRALQDAELRAFLVKCCAREARRREVMPMRIK